MTTKPATLPAVKPGARRLNAKQWAEAEALWESGSVTYDDLAAKYGAAVSSFARHFAKHKVVKGIKVAETKKEVEKQLANASIDEAMVLAARIRETKEQHYTMASNIGKLVWNEILQAKKDGNPIASAMNNIKALKEAAQALAAVRSEKWVVLGLDRPDAVDPDELPELQITELTAEQIQELRDRDHSELDDIKPAKTGDTDADDEDGVVEEDA